MPLTGEEFCCALDRLPESERRGLWERYRDAVHSVRQGYLSEGYELLDLALCRAEAMEHAPWQEDLIHCYRRVLVRFSARYIAAPALHQTIQPPPPHG